MSAAPLRNMRKDYDRDQLTEALCPSEPWPLFAQWFEQALAAGVPEPNAMTVATVGSDLRPSTRIVLMKDWDQDGLVWFTNYNSRKGRELAGNPFAALQFHWVEMERVVRIEGQVEQVCAAESDRYFQSRPVGSQIGAWVSPQSEVLAAGREELETRLQEVQTRFAKADAVIDRPPHWGGYRLRPERWEFWQGRPSRLHDRMVYVRQAEAWHLQRLAP